MPDPSKMTEAELEDRTWFDVTASSNVRRAAFQEGATRLTDEEPHGELLVQWVSGQVSRYEQVPASLMSEIERHEADPELSVGRLMHARVRLGGFEHAYVEVEPGEPTGH